MNRSRRERLKNADILVGNAMEIVEQVKDEEQESLDNIPENLQGSDRYLSMENAIDILEDALESMSDASDLIKKARLE